MRVFTSAVVLAATFLAVSAQNGYKGFNSGSAFNNNRPKQQVDFAHEMRAAKQLSGTNGAFTSMRLFTTIQAGTKDTPISAIPAAIETQSTLLRGLWAPTSPDGFTNEINALRNAITQYGTAFTDLVTGISVGSEDLYRKSVNEFGATPEQLVDFIARTRSAIAGTFLAGKPVGHVDTWNAFTNDANAAVISAIDFLGMDAYPYYQTGDDNRIGNANATFWKAYTDTVVKAQGKPVWITETGWPVIGDTLGGAVPSVDNARTYWEEAICSVMAAGINMYYFQLQTAQYGNPFPDWGIKGAGDVVAQPQRFQVTCPDYNVY